ncbi:MULTISPECIES: NUDIX domain-containing protein [Neisseria]|uniref:8-oxo-dGTP diphosphatase n=1 Tax=Neisseria musculi TaxID=1815583 RepID=A0A7H1M7X6_9NEIS|nr:MULTISPECIES: NUDIX domain-containing protein [Neisseria]MBF0804474.1 NUDIX domain-containing protein [Neisseria sp. 19428wB4_WF04]QNT57741.1 NUDIX domain protein [Neisseria musculi]TFU40540.1 NUDIX domain-containing protein [Neisseria sp. WF04]
MNTSRPFIRVVAGIVLDKQGRCLLSSRPEGKPYAGYWEFAGGKVEAGESELAALQREFEEELGIRIETARPWLTKIHDYEHARVYLRFWRVEAESWSGNIQAREGQQWSWQRPGGFTVSPMLPANGDLLAALAVPTQLAGRLKTGFYGENAMGGYRVVPFALAEPQHANVLIGEPELRARGKMPAAQSVWVVIDKAEQWPLVQDADVAVWQVQNREAAEAVCGMLDSGVALPLVVLAEPKLAATYRSRWLAGGAHAVIADDETEYV